MEKIIEKLLEDIHPDLKAFLITETNVLKSPSGYSRDVRKDVYYKNWELLDNAVLTILKWNKLYVSKK